MIKKSNNIYDNARHGLANGINICRKSVESTLGGAGKNAVIKEEFYPYYTFTKDAFSIIQAIRCEEPLEQLAVDMMKDATDSMNKIAKDGRTAMCILTDEILQNTVKEQADPLKVEKEINELLPFIESEIDKQTRQITVDDVENVARTASNSDRIAKLIGQIYKTQGKDCIINHIEASGTHEDYVLYHDGVRFQYGTGIISESFVYDEEAKKDNRTEKRAVYENPTILVTRKKILRIEEIDPLLQNLEKQGKKDLVIFATDMDGDVIKALSATHQAHVFNIALVKPSIMWQDFILEDFAKAVGATVVSDANGINFKNLALNHLGTCSRIVMDMEETVINGTADLTEHIADLKAKGDDDSMRRVWWLTTKTATIRLGATNEGELSNLRLATMDAVYSSQSALQSGIVAGGGIALHNIRHSLPETLGGKVLFVALFAPLRQIVANAGQNLTDFLEQIEEDTQGFDAKKLEVVDMFEAGIVDSALVIKNQIRQAVKIASIALKTDKLIDIPKLTLEEMQLQLLSKKQTPF